MTDPNDGSELPRDDRPDPWAALPPMPSFPPLYDDTPASDPTAPAPEVPSAPAGESYQPYEPPPQPFQPPQPEPYQASPRQPEPGPEQPQRYEPQQYEPVAVPPGYGAVPLHDPVPDFGTPGGPGGPPVYGPAGGGGRRRGLFSILIALVLAAAAAVAYFAFTGSSGASTPQEAVRRLLEASKTQNESKAKAVLCKEDRNRGIPKQLQAGERIVSYTVGETTQRNGTTFVGASVVTASGAQSESLPVVKEGGSWKVCLSKEFAFPGGGPTVGPLPTGSGLPTGLPSNLPSNLPTGIPIPSDFTTISIPTVPTPDSLCATAPNPLQAAVIYVGAAQSGIASYAQSCVYKDTVPLAVTKGLSGNLFVPTNPDESATVVHFQTVDGNKELDVTVAKKADGLYYIVKVTLV